jgi:hypothetical protein
MTDFQQKNEWQQRWRSLQPRQKNKILKLLSSIAWYPHPDNKPQIQAYFSPAEEILYGGQAGGGKSDLLLGLARTCHRKSVVLRRIFPELERSLIPRSMQFYGDKRFYNSTKHYWEVDGRHIEFGHMEHVGTADLPGDEAQYASAPYDLIGFDQLEEFPEYAYLFMMSRARTADPRQRVRVISTANPVGPGVVWIMRRWAAWLDPAHRNPAKSGEIRWYKRDEFNHDIETTPDDPYASSRTFISARLSDNPYLCYSDTYKRKLSMLPEPLRGALLNGDWLAGLVDDAYQLIPRAWVEAAMERGRNGKRPAGVPMTVLGVDVARGGDDNTVLSPRYGTWFDPLIKIPGRLTPDGMSVYNEIIKLSGDIEPGTPVAIDVAGVGSSPYDTAVNNGLNAIPINFAEGSDVLGGIMRFVNKRAQFYWAMREALDPNSGDNLSLPDDPQLMGDLTCLHWEMTAQGIKIKEKKEALKKIIGRSPDDGDAVVISWSGGGDPFGGIHV